MGIQWVLGAGAALGLVGGILSAQRQQDAQPVMVVLQPLVWVVASGWFTVKVWGARADSTLLVRLLLSAGGFLMAASGYLVFYWTVHAVAEKLASTGR
jgi:hypothetical protein